MDKQNIIFGGGDQENLIGHKLFIDVVTRWISTLYIIYAAAFK
jgi:hypothetical protein